jgi:hypothetical protein
MPHGLRAWPSKGRSGRYGLFGPAEWDYLLRQAVSETSPRA